MAKEAKDAKEGVGGLRSSFAYFALFAALRGQGKAMGALLDLALTVCGLPEPQGDSKPPAVTSPGERQRDTGNTADAAESRMAEMTREFAVELHLGCIVVCK